MERYFQYLPRKYRISYQYTSTGFIVDVNNFDRWLNSDTLRQKYDSSKVALAAQKVNTDAKMTELLTRLTEAQEKQAHRHGIFSWLKKK